MVGLANPLAPPMTMEADEEAKVIRGEVHFGRAYEGAPGCVHGGYLAAAVATIDDFHSDNPNKALMDHVFDWKLIHRSEEYMNRLFEQSKFGSPCTNIRYEEARVNLFAEGTKR